MWIEQCLDTCSLIWVCDLYVLLFVSVAYTWEEYVLISESDNSIGPDGMEKFCMDLGIEPENVSQH